MLINTIALQKLAEQRNWSIPDLAGKLGVDYSYLFRVLNKEKIGGVKVFKGLYLLCKEEKLDLENYIFFNKPLSTDNGNQNSDVV
ncbi:MAG: hypothetical protein APF76_04555 [Desulfitibacter sp. BRH_c19]|nr:MAG: hypothetical protein APF76_04555 [Desulfitibacter sp. BRH_c19]